MILGKNNYSIYVNGSLRNSITFGHVKCMFRTHQKRQKKAKLTTNHLIKWKAFVVIPNLIFNCEPSSLDFISTILCSGAEVKNLTEYT